MGFIAQSIYGLGGGVVKAGGQCASASKPYGGHRLHSGQGQRRTGSRKSPSPDTYFGLG